MGRPSDGEVRICGHGLFSGPEQPTGPAVSAGSSAPGARRLRIPGWRLIAVLAEEGEGLTPQALCERTIMDK